MEEAWVAQQSHVEEANQKAKDKINDKGANVKAKDKALKGWLKEKAVEKTTPTQRSDRISVGWAIAYEPKRI